MRFEAGRIHPVVSALLGLAGTCLAASTTAQTITVLGTPHLTGLDRPPTAEQFAHTVEALSTFELTQVCIERMSGERIQMLADDPAQHGMTFRPETHGREISTVILPLGVQMQAILESDPRQARAEAAELIARWDELDASERIHAIALQVAGYEFHSAVLNWTWLEDDERATAIDTLPADLIDALEKMSGSVHEAYSLGVPLARKAGLHALCTADALENESRGMRAAVEHGGEAILENPEVVERFDELRALWNQAWRPGDGPAALTAMLHRVNGEAFAEADRRLQWATLLEFDNKQGAFRRRVMYWHARTAAITSELFRALAQGPDERVIFIVGSSHRSFTEADLRAQPWVEVLRAERLFEARNATHAGLRDDAH